MFKRLFWFTSGAASGAAGSWWLRKRVREEMQRFTPGGMKQEATKRFHQARQDARSATTEVRNLAERYNKRG